MRWICLFLFISNAIWSVGQTEDVNQGAALLKEGKWEGAIEVYQKVLDSGQASGELHYNLGIAYAELGTIGRAIWHFELAKKWGLDTEALHHNLQLVREERKDEIEVVPEFFLKKWWNTWQGLLSSNIWAMISLVTLLGGIYGLYTWRTATERSIRKRGFVSGLVGCLLALLCVISARSAARSFENPTTGVLLVEVSNLRSAPDPESAAILELHAGADVDVRDQIGNWVKVRLANGQEGWLEQYEIGLF